MLRSKFYLAMVSIETFHYDYVTVTVLFSMYAYRVLLSPATRCSASHLLSGSRWYSWHDAFMNKSSLYGCGFY